jgi:hypothetical protein
LRGDLFRLTPSEPLLPRRLRVRFVFADRSKCALVLHSKSRWRPSFLGSITSVQSKDRLCCSNASSPVEASAEPPDAALDSNGGLSQKTVMPSASLIRSALAPIAPGTSSASAAADSAPALGSTAASIPVQKLILIANGVLSSIYGIVSAIGDNPTEESPPLVGRLSAGLGFVITCFGAPWISNDSDKIVLGWVSWGFGMGCSLGYIATQKRDSEGNLIGDQESLPFMVSCLNATLLLLYIYQFAEEGKGDPTTDLGFSSAVLTTFPGLINAVKLAPDYGPLIVMAADVVCNLANLYVAIFQANSLSSPALPA